MGKFERALLGGVAGVAGAAGEVYEDRAKAKEYDRKAAILDKREKTLAIFRHRLKLAQDKSRYDHEDNVREKDHIYAEKVRDEARAYEKGLKTGDRVYEQGLKTGDRVYNKGVKADERLYNEKIKHDDRIYNKGLKADDRIYNKGLKADDRIYNERVKADDRIYNERVKAGDRIYTKGVKARDRIYNKGVKAEDRLYDIGVRDENRAYNEATVADTRAYTDRKLKASQGHTKGVVDEARAYEASQVDSDWTQKQKEIDYRSKKAIELAHVKGKYRDPNDSKGLAKPYRISVSEKKRIKDNAIIDVYARLSQYDPMKTLDEKGVGIELDRKSKKEIDAIKSDVKNTLRLKGFDPNSIVIQDDELKIYLTGFNREVYQQSLNPAFEDEKPTLEDEKLSVFDQLKAALGKQNSRSKMNVEQKNLQMQNNPGIAAPKLYPIDNSQR